MTASLNPTISYFGETFDAEKSSQYRMAIQFALGGLSYALLDNGTKTIVGLENHQSELFSNSEDLFRAYERALEAKGLNNHDFLSVTCLFDYRYNTLIPESLFNEVEQTNYLEFAFQIPEGYAIGSDRITQAECVNVYAFPKTLKERILKKWKNAQFTHSCTHFINRVMEKQSVTNVAINVRKSDFDMVVCKNGRLHFFNNFKYNTKEDFVYFVLFALEQNGLSALETTICFSGLILPKSETIELCRRYVKDICFVDAPPSFPEIKELPFQYYSIHYQALR